MQGPQNRRHTVVGHGLPVRESGRHAQRLEGIRDVVPAPDPLFETVMPEGALGTRHQVRQDIEAQAGEKAADQNGGVFRQRFEQQKCDARVYAQQEPGRARRADRRLCFDDPHEEVFMAEALPQSGMAFQQLLRIRVRHIQQVEQHAGLRRNDLRARFECREVGWHLRSGASRFRRGRERARAARDNGRALAGSAGCLDTRIRNALMLG